jgi:hypothetical protein
VASAAATSQTGEENTAPKPTGTDSRKAIIKSALNKDPGRGEITAIEPSSRPEGGVIIGYASGVLLNCYGNDSCRVFEQTPGTAVNTPVGEIAVTRRGSSEVVWVTYPHGIIYQCVDFVCREFTWQGMRED